MAEICAPTNTALYRTDEWQVVPRWRIDFGARWERVRIDGGVERATARDLDGPATLIDDTVLARIGRLPDVTECSDEAIVPSHGRGRIDAAPIALDAIRCRLAFPRAKTILSSSA